MFCAIFRSKSFTPIHGNISSSYTGSLPLGTGNFKNRKLCLKSKQKHKQRAEGVVGSYFENCVLLSCRSQEGNQHYMIMNMNAVLFPSCLVP